MIRCGGVNRKEIEEAGAILKIKIKNKIKIERLKEIEYYLGEMNKSSSKKATKQVCLEKKTTNVLPAGKYFVGDPAYFLHDSINDALLDAGSGHYSLPDGRGFILYNVSKNSYLTTEKNSYSVDSGLFGLISFDLGDFNKYTGDGTFHTFSNPVSFIVSPSGSFLLTDGELNLEFEQCDSCFSEDEGYDSCG